MGGIALKKRLHQLVTDMQQRVKRASEPGRESFRTKPANVRKILKAMKKIRKNKGFPAVEKHLRRASKRHTPHKYHARTPVKRAIRETSKLLARGKVHGIPKLKLPRRCKHAVEDAGQVYKGILDKNDDLITPDSAAGYILSCAECVAAPELKRFWRSLGHN